MAPRTNDWQGRACPLVCLLLIAACMAGAGCSALLTEQGPLLRYAAGTAPAPSPTATAIPGPATSPADTYGPGGTGGNLTDESIGNLTEAAGEGIVMPTAYEPLLVTVLSGDTTEYMTYTVEYRSKEYTVKLPVNMSLYRAANESVNRDLIIDNREIATYYRQLIADPAMDTFYTAAAQELNKVKYTGGKVMSDDEYLEFLVSFVQQVPYDRFNTTPRTPVEVIYGRSGTGDEKAVLLAGLLGKEGYDTSLMVFPGLRHAAAGLRVHLATTKPVFPVFTNDSKDYIYAEAAETRLVSLSPDEYASAPQPVIIPVGTGTLIYRKTSELAMISYDLNTIRTNRDALQEKADESGWDLQDWEMKALASYIDTYQFVMSTNDVSAALEAIRESALPQYSGCLSCN